MMEKSHEELIKASQEDIEFFNRCTEGLPTREGFIGNYLDKEGVEIPYGSSAHIVSHFKKAIDIVKPDAILEIGFNLGHGSALLLNLFDGIVYSCDISEKEETTSAIKTLTERFPSRFAYCKKEDALNLVDDIDLIFVDGDHREVFIVEDIELAKNLNIPYILFDDCYERYGETMAAIKHFPELELVHDMDNLKLYKWIKN